MQPNNSNIKIPNSFGSLKNGRNFSAGNGYRFGFNGKEKDKEILNDAYDFGARIYDGRLGRWMSVDPLLMNYPDLSAYNFAGNSPIIFVDLEGKKFINPYISMTVDAQLKVNQSQIIYNQFIKDNPTLSNKEIRNSIEAQTLNSANAELFKVQALVKEVETYLYTLKVTNEKEFNYFENLKDAKNNSINISINLEKENKEGSAVGTTTGYSYFKEGESIIPTSNNGFNITLYKTGIISEGEVPTFESQKGRNYSTFSNELGDVKYFMENVKDDASFKKWSETLNNEEGQYSDPTGAGASSFEYEKQRIKDFDKYKTKDGETKNKVNSTIEKSKS